MRKHAKRKVDIDNAGLVYKRLLSEVKQYWWAFALGIFGTVLYSCIDASMTYAIKPALDEGFIARNANFLKWLPFLLIGVFLFRSIASFLSTYFITFVGRSLVMRFRQKIFAHLLTLPASFFDSQTSGSLLSVIIYNVEQIAEASTNALIILVRESVFVAGLIFVMLVVSWKLTFMFIATAPFIALIVRFSSRKTRGLSKLVQALVGDITHIAEEGIGGYKIIRIFNGQAYEQNKFNQVAENNRKREMKVTAINGLTSPLVQLVAGVVIVITISFASQHFAGVTVGGYAAIIVSMLAILKPMKNLTSVNNTIQRGIAAADDIFNLLDMPTEKNTGTQTLKRANGNITLNNVSFQYQQDEKVILNNINLEIKAGQTVALVGRSGAGKSTLVSLLPRFYDYQTGQILLDGTDIKAYQITELRKQFALVSQHVILFNDTIARNIAYGLFDQVTEDQIKQAAIAAHAMEFINELPDGLNTMIGEKGLRLSGGQRQRIAIARAILKNAPILILDEATSSLDTESEYHIQQALNELMKTRTTIVIAHRLSTIENADQIVVMENHQIVEQGTHAQLLQQNNVYKRLYQMQFQDHTAVARSA